MIFDDCMSFLNQIFVFSRIQVISAKATARYATRAVTNRRSDLRRLKAIILALSRIEVISAKATARHATRAVTNRRIDLR